MDKIQSITEAFSMQPATQFVLENSKNYYKPELTCKEIKLEHIQGVYDEVPTDYYVGYNFEGQKIFQYLSKSVNVHYNPI